MYTSLFDTSQGGIIVLASVNNTNASESAWAAWEAARYNHTVHFFDVPPFASVNDSVRWPIQDPFPLVPADLGLLGGDLASVPQYRFAIDGLLDILPDPVPPDNVPIPMNGHHVSVSGLLSAGNT